MTSFERAALAGILVLTLAIVATGSAGAADKPTFNNCGKFAKDNASDATATVGDPPAEVEIENAWFSYDAAKGADGVTVNLTIKNLTSTVPPPSTSITYLGVYSTDMERFVRAHVDYTGMVYYEYGHIEPLAASTRYAYEGATKGEFFLGEHGVAQIVIPPEAGGKPGTTLKALAARTQVRPRSSPARSASRRPEGSPSRATRRRSAR